MVATMNVDAHVTDPRRVAFLLLVLLSILLVACDVPACKPTVTVAEDAALVVAPDAAKSGVLVATLTTEGRALAGKSIEFSVDDALIGSPTLGSDTTDARGRARLDLKSRPLRFVKTVNEDEYTAAFAGDGTYCSSSDAAAIDIAHVK
jgi:hypothetical protein